MKAIQINLFRPVEEVLKQPLIVAYGLGVDSTAVLVELERRGIIPDAILFADTGEEKQETYDYLPIISSWLSLVGFPQVTVVRNKPKNLKKGFAYKSLGQEVIANRILPSLAYGRKSCSLKWKVAPQNKWTNRWQPALDYWKAGGKIKKIIGYDAGAKDMKRYAHSKGIKDAKYDYWYPLVEWGMDREMCKAAIQKAGLPVPPKSACKFCPATKPEELMEFRKSYLRGIVLMEARAVPRLRGHMNEQQLVADYQSRHSAWEQKLETARGASREKLLKQEPRLQALGSGCRGLWRTATKSRPAMMTDFIQNNGLLTGAEIEKLREAANMLDRPAVIELQRFSETVSWQELIEFFTVDLMDGDCGCTSNFSFTQLPYQE
ncbi:hypothetical protein SAMN04488128_103715 [Chitinophaga eiseniae]|uniref:3'-phosphoadenosine 5'-phosphosulfate sulfotransferase (PAPS reductase)/FAD synthetase n=1 Tax=Chitinophaga eiseniae TaxID=634771 RepID=A0A1T4SWX4_9BACT|nr:hypothetical protein [Chitinophaga eiseniae]SKA32764.1 hypothetical protein SAMN04488128_103715 [Chitinophaga eiseniae]